MAELLVNTETFACEGKDGSTETWGEGEFAYADSPIVRRFPASFEVPRVTRIQGQSPAAGVEQATKAPGEKRRTKLKG